MKRELTPQQIQLLEPVGSMHLEQMKRLQLTLEIQKRFGAKAANRASQLLKDQKVAHPKFDKQKFIEQVIKS